MRTASVIELTDEQRQQLQRWMRSSTVSVRLARRARIILLAAEGMDNHQIAGEVSAGRIQVGRWRKRFAQSGLPGIEADLPRSRRKRRNQYPKPFVWTAKANDILQKVIRANRRLRSKKNEALH